MDKMAYSDDKKSIIETMTYVEALKAGLIDYEDIFLYIEKWHKSNFSGEIYEYLGITNKEYGVYLEEHIKGLKKMYPVK